jgi:hypothetical protein
MIFTVTPVGAVIGASRATGRVIAVPSPQQSATWGHEDARPDQPQIRTTRHTGDECDGCIGACRFFDPPRGLLRHITHTSRSCGIPTPFAARTVTFSPLASMGREDLIAAHIGVGR